ncbi:MAG: serine hydrolase domain-containing protein, partial [Lachnospiraceae bacterium]
MTLEQLATHTSGLPRMPRNWCWGPNPYKNYTRDKLKEFMQENILSRKPGSVYEYSNLSFGLLGCILEDIEKTPYAQLVQSRICEPLDMKNTVMVLSPDQKKMKAKPYSTKDTKGYEWDFDALSACAGLKSNTRDLARYVAANMEQIPLSKELTEAFSMAHKVHFKGDPTLGLAFSKEYGVGVAVLCNSAD